MRTYTIEFTELIELQNETTESVQVSAQIEENRVVDVWACRGDKDITDEVADKYNLFDLAVQEHENRQIDACELFEQPY